MNEVKGFSQKLTDIRYVAACGDRAENIEDVSLNEMALRCLNYLSRTPNPDNFECKFSNGPLGVPWHYPLSPPNETAFDPVSLGDTDVRNAIAFPYMREMAHIPAPGRVEQGLRARLDGYMSEEGVCIQGAQAFAGEQVDGEWNCLWGTSHMVVIYCDEYARTGDETLIARAKKAMDFWIDAADVKDGMLYFEYGGAPFQGGEWLSAGWAKEHKTNYPYIIVALLRVYLCSGDKKYLDAAVSFGYGVTHYCQSNMGSSAIKPDGSFKKHVPLHTKLIAGMAMLGAVTKIQEFIEFACNAYRFVVRMGTDFGWYPEYIPPEENLRSETCVTGDMLEIAYYLIACGYTGEYDCVERTYLNYLQSAQFKITDAFEALYFKVHESGPQQAVRENFDSLRQLEGGFVAQLSINDYITNFKHLGATGMNENGFQMMGCCPGAGMNGLYYIYKMLCEKEGDTVRVNMSLNGETDYAVVKADYAAPYKLTVTAKTDGDFWIRVPSWTDFDAVKAVKNGVPVAARPDEKGYVRIGGVQVTDIIEVDYPLVSFVQEFTPLVKDTGERYKIHWVGNRVTGMTPKGKLLNIY